MNSFLFTNISVLISILLTCWGQKNSKQSTGEFEFLLLILIIFVHLCTFISINTLRSRVNI